MISRSRSAPTAEAMSIEWTTSANSTVTCLYSAVSTQMSVRAPHSSQNLALSRRPVPHDPHATSAAIRAPPIQGSRPRMIDQGGTRSAGPGSRVEPPLVTPGLLSAPGSADLCRRPFAELLGLLDAAEYLVHHAPVRVEDLHLPFVV